MDEDYQEIVFKELNENYKKLELLVSDIIQRSQLAGKMALSKFDDKFEFFGDKWLVMNDFWEQLSDENRVLLLGGMMNGNTMHCYYGKYKKIFDNLSNIINEYDKFKKTGNDMFADVPQVDNSKPSYLG